MFILTWAEIFRGRDRVWYVLEWQGDSKVWNVWTLGTPIYPFGEAEMTKILLATGIQENEAIKQAFELVARLKGVVTEPQ